MSRMNSTILRLHRKQARGRYGHEGDGQQGQEGGAAVWCQHHHTICPGHGKSKLKIFGGMAACAAMVQLCEPQPTWCRYGEVLPASREGIGGREIKSLRL